MKKAEPFFDTRDLVHIQIRFTYHYPETVRRREVGLSYADWLAFGDAWQELYPAGRWLIDLRSKPWAFLERSHVLVDHLCAVMVPNKPPLPRGGFPYFIRSILDPSWQPEYFIEKGVGGCGDSALLTSRHLPSVAIMPGCEVLEEDKDWPQRLHGGQIAVNCEKGNEAHLAFARRVFRLFSRFATNRNQLAISYPSYRARIWEKGSYAWLGHDAMRWAREHPRRMLLFQQWHGFRPYDPDWSTELALNAPTPDPVS